MKRCATLALLISITASAASAADPVELSAFIALTRPEPTLQVRYGAESSQGSQFARNLSERAGYGGVTGTELPSRTQVARGAATANRALA
jgi:hypothetical protein